MGAFRQLDESKLVELDDAELIEYVLGARAAGSEEQAEVALKIFAFGMEDAIRAFVRSKLDSQPDTLIEEVAERALEDAIRSIANLRGNTPEEARGLVFKIARRRIADFHRTRRLKTTSIDDHGRLESPPHQEHLRIEDQSGSVGTVLLLDQVLEELRSDHRAVVEMFVISGYSARETVELVRSRFDGRYNDSMSQQNVHQIASRFRKDLRARLEQAGEEVTR